MLTRFAVCYTTLNLPHLKLTVYRFLVSPVVPYERNVDHAANINKR